MLNKFSTWTTQKCPVRLTEDATAVTGGFLLNFRLSLLSLRRPTMPIFSFDLMCKFTPFNTNGKLGRYRIVKFVMVMLPVVGQDAVTVFLESFSFGMCVW